MRKLDENSFASLNDVGNIQNKGYLATHGIGYYSIKGNYFWVRTKEVTSSNEYQKNYWDSKIPINDLIQECNANSENGYGKQGNAMSIEHYNQFVRCGIWDGAYVERFGMIDIAASSLYGNSIFINSWIECGKQENPVSLSRFYELKEQSRWRGGYVDNWGYQSESVQIPNTSLSFVKVDDGYCTLGAIVNAFHWLGIDCNMNEIKKDLDKYWNKEYKRYIFDGRITMEELLGKYFIVEKVSNLASVTKAISRHKPVYVHFKNFEDENIKQYHDVILIEVNNIKEYYVYFDPVKKERTRLDKEKIYTKDSEYNFYILDKKEL